MLGRRQVINRAEFGGGLWWSRSPVGSREGPSAASGTQGRVPGVVRELLATERAVEKLGGRGISLEEAAQLPRNRHVTVRNPRDGAGTDRRRLLVGRTDGGRVLTLVIERTVEPTTWLVVTGWSATLAERRILPR